MTPLPGHRISTSNQTELALPRQTSRSDSRAVDSLAQRLTRLTGKTVSITITNNTSRFASFRTLNNQIALRLHNIFVDASDEVLAGIAEWIKQPRFGVPLSVSTFVQNTPRPATRTRKRRLLNPKGRVFDLTVLYEEINQRHFAGQVKTSITYGRNTSHHKVDTRLLGSFSRRDSLITIHPLLDSERVPVWVISFTIFHEMLHSLQPPGTKRPHDREFRTREAQHPDYERVMKWRKDNHLWLSGRERKRAS